MPSTPVSYQGIAYNAATNSYTIDATAATADINAAILYASAGATVNFTAGVHTLTSTLYVTRSDITLQGAGRDETTFKLDFTSQDFTGISVKGKADTSFQSTLSSATHEDAYSITLKNASGLKVGDVLEIQEPNTAGNFNADGRYDNMVGTDMWEKAPLRQTIAQIKSISGNTVTLDTPIAYDMDSDVTTVQRLSMLTDVTLKGFTVKPDLGNVDAPNPNLFENQLPDFSANVAVSVRYTLGVKVDNIAIVDAASRGLQVQQALYANVNDYIADGAYNKGSNGNGYPLHLEESFYGNFTHISTIDTRHGVIMGSNTAEVGNYIQVDYSNRDVNFHGSPDHDNIIIVDKNVYVGQTRDEASGVNNKGWTLVADGAPDHAWTDLNANTVLFKYASGGYKDDNIQGWDGGSQLFGGGGNDTLNGGAGADILSGGAGDDTLIGNGGPDMFLHAWGDGNDVLTDFKTGSGGDQLALAGYGDLSFSDLHFTQQGADTLLFFGVSGTYNDSILLKNVSASALNASNVVFVDPGEPDAAREVGLSSGADNFQTGAGNDVIRTWISYLTAGDVIHAGAGMDSIQFLSYGTFNTALFTKLDGIDMLDFSMTSGERVTISDAFAAQSDTGNIIVKYGAGVLAQLDTSALTAGHSVTIDGSGTVQLTNNAGNRVIISDAGSGKVTGGTGADDITFGKENDTVAGGAGRDTFRVSTGGGSDTIMDFKSGSDGDTLILSSYKGVKSFADLNLTQQGADTLLSFGASGAVLLKNVTASSLTAANFQIIAPVNHAPAATADNFSGAQDKPVSGNVLSNDNDPDGDALSAVAGNITTAYGGTVVMKADGSFVYTPANGFSGTDSFSYTVRDEDGLQADGAATIALAALPPPAGDMNVALLKTANKITTGAGNDTISGYFSYLKAGDIIHAGAGTDTIRFASQSTLTTSKFVNITGIDVLDFSATTGERIIFDNRFVAQADSGNITVAYGAGNLLKVDSSAVDAAHKVYVSGSGEAHINDTAGNALYIADTNTGHIYGGKYADDITFGKGNDLVTGGAGQDVFHIASGGGNDVITDFQAGASGDKVSLSGYTGANSFADLHFTQQGADTLLSFGSADSLVLQNVKASALTTANFEIVGGTATPPPSDPPPSGAADMNVSLTKTVNIITTDSGDDTITGYFSYLKTGDTISAGAGHDTLHFLSQSTFTAAQYAKITGIDVLDFSATTGERLILDDRIVDQSDNDLLTIAYGSGNLLKLDTSAVSSSHKVYVDGSGEAHLADNAGNRVYVADSNTGDIFGGSGADAITGGSGNDTLYGMGGNDVLFGGAGADHLSGGAGNDVFKFSGITEGGDVISDFNLLVGERDTLDLTELFAANGLGNENAVAAIAAGHLTLSLNAQGVDVGFDKDGLLGPQQSVHIVTLEGHDIVHLDLTAILTLKL